MSTLVQPGPGRYVHERGSISQVGPMLRALGIDSVAIISGRRSFAAAGTQVLASLESVSVRSVVHRYGGECSEAEVERLRVTLKTKVDAIVAVGGGKVLDVGKILADVLKLPCVTIPTLISNCAATNPNTTVYFDDGRFHRQYLCQVPPLVALADDDVLEQSPRSYFASGLGDTIAKPYEAILGLPTQLSFTEALGVQMADASKALVVDHGSMALQALAHSKGHPQLANLIDAVLLVAGMVGGIGGDAARSAVAHAFHNALTQVFPTLHATHGSKVAYGLLVQEQLWGRGESEMRALAETLASLRLPVTWYMLAGETKLPSDDLLLELADKTIADLPSALASKITGKAVVMACRGVEARSAGAQA